MRLLLFCLVITSSLSLDAQSAYLSRAELQKELSAIRTTLERYHPRPYYYRDTAEVTDLETRLGELAADSLPREAAYRRLDRFVNFFNDAHTRLYAADLTAAYQEAGGTYLPLDIDATGTTLRIRRVLDPAADPALAGQAVHSINGVPAAQLLADLRAHAGRETTELDDALLSTNFPHFLWKAYGWTGPYRVTLATATGTPPPPQTLPGVSYVTLRQQRVSGRVAATGDAPVSYRILADGSAYLRIRDFERLRRKAFRAAFAEAFAYFRAAGATERLVLDLRDHNGGDARVGADLARYLTDASFRPFAYSLWKATPDFKQTFKQVYLPRAIHWALPVIKGLNPHTKAIYGTPDGENARVEYPLVRPFPARRRYPGETVLLINEHTFSAGTCFAAMFKDYRMGTIVGRPSGNLANFCADALLRLRLPHSGTALRISTSYLVRPSGDESIRPVQPDVRVPRGMDILAYGLATPLAAVE